MSHLGEAELKKKEVLKELEEQIRLHKNISGSEIDIDKERLIATIKKEEKNSAPHEKLSCIIILKYFVEKIRSRLKEIKDKGIEDINADFEFIVRCILGISYKYEDITKDKPIKNVLIQLINSPNFDMDKLDYIMRDSYYTAISVPMIDTQRLFRNMYLSKSGEELKTVFKSKAVASLQNFIEARDNLYMWVYNPRLQS